MLARRSCGPRRSCRWIPNIRGMSTALRARNAHGITPGTSMLSITHGTQKPIPWKIASLIKALLAAWRAVINRSWAL